MLLEELIDLKTTTLIGMVNRLLKKGVEVHLLTFDEDNKPVEGRLKKFDQHEKQPKKFVVDMGWTDGAGKVLLIAALTPWEAQNSELTRKDGGYLLTVPNKAAHRKENDK